MGKRINYKNGDKIGNLIFIKDEANCITKGGRKIRQASFSCLRCNTVFITHIDRVKSGHTKSCGCLKSENIKTMTTTHGLSDTRLYGVWSKIKDRCYNENDKGYVNYGGRGIGIYDLWKNDFKSFYDYATSLEGYTNEINKVSIDRINNDGNYEPGNIRWVDSHIQNTNKRIKTGKSGYNGVSYYGFSSGITINRKRIHIGFFETAIEAATARDKYIIDNELWEYPLQVINKNK